MNRVDPRLIILTLAAVVIQVVGSISCIVRFGPSYEATTGIWCSAICLIPYFLSRFNLMNLPIWLCAMILIAVGIHSMGVMTFAYDNYVHYDIITHAFSSFVITICIVLTLMVLQRNNVHLHLSLNICSVFVLLIMISFGVIWEVFEFFIDLLCDTGMQYSPWDTIHDMISDTVGAVFGSVFIAILMRHKSEDELLDSIHVNPVVEQRLSGKK